MMLLIFALSFLLVSPAAGLVITAPILEMIGLSHFEAGIMGVFITVLSSILGCMYAFLRALGAGSVQPGNWENTKESARKVRESFNKVKEGYEVLPPETKERVHVLGADLARLACKAGSEHLAKRGKPTAAAAFDRLSKF
ncbi:hypothetical protein GW937_01495 [Candidatus Kaiserbacteria bacterium]|nr:hypothetical protein [Candidatus Kaiserbacteria bacterium]